MFQERTGIAGKTGRRCWDGGGGWGTGYVNWNAWGRMDGRGRRWKGCPDSEAPETLNINTFSHLCPFSDIHWLGSLRVDRDTHTHPPSLALPLSPNWVPTENERRRHTAVIGDPLCFVPFDSKSNEIYLIFLSNLARIAFFPDIKPLMRILLGARHWPLLC